ncbi:uncharacterized protein AMSG_08440 [Thecamonas trahens ATCC 50062]|uniref:Uncharacterized protein n=1 Tax=Thecamonas trahens ATCC 50062 TaxID=461836 RepID=A0A0L0DMH2_THETB|nr:hypothetical protein AMSG_08440 [Thecamonas trahens ATCC 50062]KNC52578.1 hypothetical protein AMSG_08440 [Thecamonas trahens ATCC 50062]|eukprot:XP_013755138.1 hypothetical protein AMSG_08440 [Thecamonas trahens ATCC 50062]
MSRELAFCRSEMTYRSGKKLKKSKHGYVVLRGASLTHFANARMSKTKASFDLGEHKLAGELECMCAKPLPFALPLTGPKASSSLCLHAPTADLHAKWLQALTLTCGDHAGTSGADGGAAAGSVSGSGSGSGPGSRSSSGSGSGSSSGSYSYSYSYYSGTGESDNGSGGKSKAKVKTKHSRLDHVLSEIVHTEKAYLADLQLLVDVLASAESKFEAELVARLFGNIGELYAVHSEIVAALDSGDSTLENVVDVFVAAAGRFVGYKEYCEKQNEFNQVLDEAKASDPQFAAFLADTLALPQSRSLPLSAFALAPVQRVLKYHLLFDSLAKAAAGAEVSYAPIADLVELYSAVAAGVDKAGVDTTFVVDPKVVEHRRRLAEKVPSQCSECGGKPAAWVSPQTGQWTCFRCAFIYRTIGLRVTPAKAPKASDKQIDFVCGLTSRHASAIYEANMEAWVEYPTPTDDDAVVRQFIAAKYVERKWFDQTAFAAVLSRLGIQLDDLDDGEPELGGVELTTMSSQAEYDAIPTVKQGWLVKMRHNRWQRRWWVLKGTSLFYFGRVNDSSKISRAKGVMQLSKSVSERSDGYGREHVIVTRTPLRDWVLQADDADDAQAWCEILESAARRTAAPPGQLSVFAADTLVEWPTAETTTAELEAALGNGVTVMGGWRVRAGMQSQKSVPAVLVLTDDAIIIGRAVRDTIGAEDDGGKVKVMCHIKLPYEIVAATNVVDGMVVNTFSLVALDKGVSYLVNAGTPQVKDEILKTLVAKLRMLLQAATEASATKASEQQARIAAEFVAAHPVPTGIVNIGDSDRKLARERMCNELDVVAGNQGEALELTEQLRAVFAEKIEVVNDMKQVLRELRRA